jgi:hypothetical protein
MGVVYAGTAQSFCLRVNTETLHSTLDPYLVDGGLPEAGEAELVRSLVPVLDTALSETIDSRVRVALENMPDISAALSAFLESLDFRLQAVSVEELNGQIADAEQRAELAQEILSRAIV